MTTLAAKHDAFGGGDLRMGASSPFDLSLSTRRKKITKKVREYADTAKHSQQQNEESRDDSGEQNHGESSGPPKHAGFWDHSMVNVRMHVI